MITINLLPKDLQTVDHASPMRIGAIAASALIGLISCVFYLFVHFSELANANKALKDAQDRRASLVKFEKQHAKLNTLIGSFKTRDTAVESVSALKVPFSKKIYEFSELLGRGNHPVWLENLTIKPLTKTKTPQRGRRRRGKPAPAKIQMPKFSWKAQCVCASDTLNKANAFYLALRNDKTLYKDFLEGEVFRYTLKKLDKGYQQEIGWSFDLNLTMQIQPPPKPEVKQDKKRNKRRGR